MKIAILSKADASGGGASRIAEDLCRLLNENGHLAHHYLAIKRPDNSTARSLYGSFGWAQLFRRLHRLVKRAGFPELIPWELFLLRLQNIRQYDLLHFHDLPSAISPFTVKYLARRKPTVWTFHDCSPFTGGCIQPLTCERFKSRCGNCPQLGAWPVDVKFDFTGFMQDIKRKAAQEDNFVAVAPSNWMAKMALSSGMFHSLPKTIPNAVNINLLRPLDKPSLREKLGLPQNRFIILILAAYIDDEIKGVKYARQALAGIKHLRPYILFVGNMEASTLSQFDDFDSHETGYISNDPLKAQYLAAADLFLYTSIADNLPLVVLETMACATPTVGFATGGVPEMVQHNHTGYLVAPKDIPGLVTGIKLALADNRAAQWGRNARQRAETLYSQEIFLQNHLNLYEQVIRNFNS